MNLSVSPLLSVSLVGAAPGGNGVMAMARLREALSARDLGVSDVGLTVTSSAGVAEHLVGEPIDRTLQRADEALYAAKAAGRDACRLSEPPLIAHPGLRAQA